MKPPQLINPLVDLGPGLLSIQKPARYLGGELGSRPPIKAQDKRFRFALCFPDLYEIGMANNAMRIIYNDANDLDRETLICERVFAPEPDFEALLAAKSIPLYTLESGIPLCDCDLLGFSIGYELLATNMITVLQSGGIPVRTEERGGDTPIVIAGGPASTNPHPFGAFLDAVYIGEAEAGFYPLLKDLAAMKLQGASKREMLELLASCENIWLSPRLSAGGSGSLKPGRKTFRAVDPDFHLRAARTALPVPILQPVQSHGTVEIMRGCPNGCRFCHAGYYYRPQRVKSPELIRAEVQSLVDVGGYREITLASLSTGDYPGIAELFRQLNNAWNDRFISFQLPSLKVDSFSLPLLAEVAQLRKSGLTFAVETPVESWQRSINKVVSFDHLTAILKEAKRYGFKSAKFYFMIGLPVPEQGRGEGRAIIDFLHKLYAAEPIAMNVNIGTFVPKPHTAYQWSRQITEDEALQTIYMIKDEVRHLRQISISYHSPFSSALEGILSRGDDRVGELLLEAHRRGARLEAWDDHIDKSLWRTLFEDFSKKEGRDIFATYLGPRERKEALPWDDIQLFVSKGFLEKEMACSEESLLTSACSEDCDHLCGSCNDSFKVLNSIHEGAISDNHEALESSMDAASQSFLPKKLYSWSTNPNSDVYSNTLEDTRLVVSFKKTGKAVFYPLHSISGIFIRACTILDLPVRYTDGFNPLPKMELTQPLFMGVESLDEVLALWLLLPLSENQLSELRDKLSACLPTGIEINMLRQGKKRSLGKNSIGSLYWGSSYGFNFFNATDMESFLAELAALSIPVLQDDKPPVNRLSVKVELNDARGGERNAMKLLSKALDSANSTESLLERCKVMRLQSFATQENGSRGDALYLAL